jgi:AraC family transcriptional regulator, transcriptional activator of pobA
MMDTGRHAESRESQGPSYHPAPAGVEVQLLRSSLARSEWTFRGTRHRAFLLQAGSGLVQSGGVETPIAAPCIVWLPAGRKATLSFEAGSRGASLAVSEVDLGRAIPVGPNATQLRSALAQTIVGAKLPPERARRIADTLGLMEEEARQDQPAAQDAVVHLLAVFLIALWRISRPVLNESQPLPRTIVHNFLQAVELHLRDHWTVARYAAFVGVTSDRLNSAVRRATGRSPLALLHARLVAEASALIDNSGMQIAEVAETLGFRDPAYFSRFFKRETGQSPNRHRLEAAGRAARGVGSFAAWP